MEEQMYMTIARVLNGEATAAEQQELEAWLASDPGNRQVFEDIKTAWNDADTLFREPAFDHEAAWKKISVSLGEPGKQAKVIRFPGWQRYMIAAAAMLIAVVIVWNTFTGRTIEVKALAGNEEITLPDQSHVTLRKGSRLVYPKHFGRKERHVTLNGEAFFDVARNEKQPFTIDAGTATVKVLGTSFNVIDKDSAVCAVVATGKVEVRSNKHEDVAVILNPGEKGSVIKDQAHKETVHSGNFLYWKTGELVFNNKTLREVVTDIGAYAGIDIRLQATAEHQDQVVNISFHKQSTEDMLTELSMITNSEWRLKDDAYIISARK